MLWNVSITSSVGHFPIKNQGKTKDAKDIDDIHKFLWQSKYMIAKIIGQLTVQCSDIGR